MVVAKCNGDDIRNADEMATVLKKSVGRSLDRKSKCSNRSQISSSLSSARWWWHLAFFSLLLVLALPLVALGLAHRVWVRRKGLVGLREKLTGRGSSITPGQILVHGVSLGEVNLMRPLVPHLEAQLGARCFLTTTTETGRARLDEVFADRQRAFLPLDLPWAVWTFLRRTKPRLVILLELEVWPVLLCMCHLRGIPVMLLNARVSERSFRGYRRAGALLRPMLRPMALALGQNPTWSARLVALGMRRDRVVVSGSMKADMVASASIDVAQQLAIRFGLRGQQPLLLLWLWEPKPNYSYCGLGGAKPPLCEPLLLEQTIVVV